MLATRELGELADACLVEEGSRSSMSTATTLPGALGDPAGQPARDVGSTPRAHSARIRAAGAHSCSGHEPNSVVAENGAKIGGMQAPNKERPKYQYE